MLYAGIASYDYSIGSKWTLAWFSISMLVLAFAIITEIKDSQKK